MIYSNTGYKHVEKVVQLHVKLHRIFTALPQYHIHTIYVETAQGVNKVHGIYTRS